MNREFFISLLAMDVYNRDYNAGVETRHAPAGLGNAIISKDSSILVSNGQRIDQPAGFYAIAYDWNGQTVLSYRGTDDGLTRDIAFRYWQGLSQR